MTTTRQRPDRCPGVLRPWPADDGALVRLRLPGGRLPTRSLLDLIAVAERHGDGVVHLTGRANLQVRGLPLVDGVLPEHVVADVEATGLLPSRAHDLVRNLMASPQTGLAGGRADLRPVVAELDALLCAEPRTARLPGRFLFVLDDGRGDLADRDLDLGLIALDADTAQLRLGTHRWGATVALADAGHALLDLALAFLDARGSAPEVPWHVDELPGPLATEHPRAAPDLPATGPLPADEVAGGHHHVPADGVVTRDLAEALARDHDLVVVTPWRGLLAPRPDPSRPR